MGYADAINAYLVEHANGYLETRRKEKTPQGHVVSEEQIRKESGLFKQGLRLAVKLGEFKGDPRLVMPEDLGPCRVRERCPPPDEFWALCRRATDHRRRWLVLYAHSGADISELHKVERTREYMDLKRGKHGAIFLNGGKTAYRQRWVPLSAAAREVVDELLEISDEGRHPSRMGMLMPSTWESGSFAKTVRPWCRELGIEPVIVKDLRRFYCTELRKARVPESDVYKLLGQRDSRMIRRIYDRRDDSAFEYVADALPSEADMRQNNVVPIGIPGESKGTEKGAASEKA